MTKVFIDGSAGTTGLRIHERLKDRKDIELIILDDEHRKDDRYIQEALLSSDISFLCLPDDAALEAVRLAGDSPLVIIDTSTAHRTAPGWEYGFPELTGARERIAHTNRIANPGCHASGFISLVAPLIEAGIMPRDIKLTCTSLTGYSGAGRKGIAQYEESSDSLLKAPRLYALGQKHKHIPEITSVCSLKYAPVFCPVIEPFYSGMEVIIPVFADELNGNIAGILDVYRGYYGGSGIISVNAAADEEGFLSAARFSGKDSMEISVFGNDERIVLVSRFDNLGKGASGAAIQNMNIVMGVEETCGLVLD